jgi:hypothetical protein
MDVRSYKIGPPFCGFIQKQQPLKIVTIISKYKVYVFQVFANILVM